MSNSPPYDPNQPQYGSVPPYDPNQPPQYGGPPPAPQWNPPAPADYSQPGTYASAAGGYPPQAGAFNPQLGGYGQAPPKKSRAGLWIGIGAVVLLLLCVLCGGLGWLVYQQSSESTDTLPGTSASSAGPAGAHRVRYEVTGTGQAAITWSKTDQSSGVDQQTVTLPWSIELGTDRETLGLTIIAAVRGEGTLNECTISVDGRELASKSAGSGDLLLTCVAIFME
jgi:hypothetical protein